MKLRVTVLNSVLWNRHTPIPEMGPLPLLCVAWAPPVTVPMWVPLLSGLPSLGACEVLSAGLPLPDSTIDLTNRMLMCG